MCKVIEDNHKQWTRLANAIDVAEARSLIRKMKKDLVLLDHTWANDTVSPEAVELMTGKLIGKGMKLVQPLRELAKVLKLEEE